MRVLSSLLLALAMMASAPAIVRADDPKPDAPKPEEPKGDKGEKGDKRGPRGGRPGGDRGDRPSITERLKEPLGLTEDQIKKIKEIEAEAKAEFEKQREANKGAAPDREAMRKQMKENRDKINAKIRETLTEEQKKKWDELLKKEEEARKERGGRGGKGGKGGEGGKGGAPAPDSGKGSF